MSQSQTICYHVVEFRLKVGDRYFGAELFNTTSWLNTLSIHAALNTRDFVVAPTYWYIAIPPASLRRMRMCTS